MANPVIMPRQGQSVESCIIAKWYKQKGDKVEIGDLLFSYETDKASFEEEAKVSGIFLGSFFDEGDDVPCLINVCVIGNEGEDISEFNPDDTVEQAGAQIVEPPSNGQAVSQGQEENVTVTEAATMILDDSNIKISPRAKNLAEKIGIDYRYASPSGPYDRIIEKDIIALKEAGIVFTAAARDEQMKGKASSLVSGSGIGGRITINDLNAAEISSAASTALTTPETIAVASIEIGVSPANSGAVASAANAGPEGANESMYYEVKISNMRKVIAKAMMNSLSSTAQLTLKSSFDATEIMEFRKKIKEGKDRIGLENITINDTILYAVSRTLLNHKDLNANFLEDRMLYFRNVNLGMAVDTERGLMVPTLMNANLKSLNEISKEAKKLAKDCQAGSINPDLLKNASFTITNLGTLGIESFTPVLNPPQTGILGVCNIVQRAKEVDGKMVFYPAMGLSLSFDHKALDGAPAARFLQELARNLENFSALLVR